VCPKTITMTNHIVFVFKIIKSIFGHNTLCVAIVFSPASPHA
jgi:hypothetical protein